MDILDTNTLSYHISCSFTHFPCDSLPFIDFLVLYHTFRRFPTISWEFLVIPNKYPVSPFFHEFSARFLLFAIVSSTSDTFGRPSRIQTVSSVSPLLRAFSYSLSRFISRRPLPRLCSTRYTSLHFPTLSLSFRLFSLLSHFFRVFHARHSSHVLAGAKSV